MQGRLIFLMGPSGSGKDSVIDAARSRLAAIPVDVVRRVITRSAESIGEQALGVSDERFADMQFAGDFAMNWRANGHYYGIPADINQHLADNRHVLVNGSRGYLPEARRLYPGLLPVLLGVDTAVLRQRLLARGREGLEEIELRLRRNERLREEARLWQAGEGDIEVLDNSGSLEQAVEALMALLARHGINAVTGRT
jgi:ribose 1,5-bisphosphokinase